MIILLSKKGYTILFILVFAFTAAVFYFGFKYEKKYFTLIVDPNLKVKYDGKNWIIITDNLAKLEPDVEVYDYNGYLGKYGVSYLKNNNRWIVYDKDMKEVDNEGDIVAFKSKLNTKYYEVAREEISLSDRETIDKILKNNKIDITSENAYSSKYRIDLNGDRKEDTLFISNLFSSDNVSGDAYTLALAIIKNKEYVIKLIGQENDNSFMVPALKLDAIFDVDGDGYKEIVLTSSSYGDSNVCVSVTGIVKNGIKALVQC